jgi:hypothetical protein
MNPYGLNWLQSAINDLAAIWTASPDQAAVTRAADALDAELVRNGRRNAKAVSEGLFSLTLAPLRVLFTVDETARVVEVVSVQRIAPPSGPLGNGFASPAT